MKKAVVVGAVAVVAVAAAVLLTVPRRGARREAVRFGYHKISANLPLFVALDKGFFAEQGITVEPVVVKRTEDQVNALLTGELDAAGASGFSYLFLVEQREGGKLKIVLPLVEDDSHYANHLLVRAGSDISSPEQLRGKVVGTYTGAAQRVYLDLVLEALGLTNKVTVRQVDAANQVQALASGDFDALFTIDPFPALAVQKGAGRVLIENPRCKYLMNPFPVASFVFSTRFTTERSATARKVYLGLAKAVDFIRKDEKEARRVWLKYLDIEADIVPLLGVYNYQKLEEVDSSLLWRLSEFFAKHRILEASVDPRPMILRAPQIGLRSEDH